MGIQSLPLSKSKRKFRVRRVTMHRALSAALWAVLLFLSLTGSRLAFAQGGLQRVNHIIIVMQENHSFDNYFGALAYAPGSPYHNANGACLPSDHKCVDGLSCVADVSGNLTCSNSNLEDDGSTVVAFHEPSRCVIPDFEHSWFGTPKQVNFLNPNSTLTNFLSDGFVKVNDVAGQLDNGTETSTEDQTMGFYNQNDIPFYYDLAQKFAIDDRYFASLLGPTFPNRSYLMAATSFGHLTSADTFPPPGGYKPISGTVFDLLTQNGVSWADYFQDAPQGASFLPFSAQSVRFSGNHRDHLIGEAALLRPIPSRRHVEVGLARCHRLVHETGPKNGRSYQPVRSA